MDNRNTNDLDANRDNVAGATGGAGGAVAGAALGSLAGPIGTIIGGLAGAVGGWWAGKAVADSPAFNAEDDNYYQTHHSTRYGSTMNTADQSSRRFDYNDVRPAYQLGHLAGVNPDYQNRSFDDIEPHLQSAYSSAGQNDWTNVRQYAQDAWSRGRQVGSERFGSSGMGSGAGLAGGTGSERVGFDSANVGTGNSTLGDYGRDLRDGAAGLGDRIADAADDLKDRVDGNPASRPGRDSTDRPGR